MNSNRGDKIKSIVKSTLHLILVSITSGLFIKLLIFNHGEQIKYYFKQGSIVYDETLWMKELEVHLTGYAIVIVPIFNFYTYFYVTEYFEKRRHSPSIFTRALGVIFGPAVPTSSESLLGVETKLSYASYEPIYCLVELLMVFLVRDSLHHHMLNKVYIKEDGSYILFYDEYFLVFANRLAAFVTPLIFLVVANKAIVNVPLQKFIYCSATHIISGFCFYEGTKYIEFATQVRIMWKSLKVIPVMLMSWLISGSKYSKRAYVTGALMSVGMMLLLFGSTDEQLTLDLSLAGVALTVLYITCTSFTSVWQEHLFTTYQITPEQMMFGMNFWTVFIYGATLVQRHNIEETLTFFKVPEFVMDLTLLVLVSALGHWFVLKTISKFRAVLFAVIMMLRIEITVLLLRVLQGHWLSPWGCVGAFYVFFISLYKIYNSHHRRRVPYHDDIEKLEK